MPKDESTSSSSSNEAPPVQDSSASYQGGSLIAGHNIWEWIFLLLSIINVVLLLVSSGISLAQCDFQYSFQSPEFTTEVLVISVSGLALLFAIYGVHEEHQYDILLHLVFMFVADFFSFLASEKMCYHFFKTVSFYVAVSVTFINCVMAFKATHALDWTEFRIIGASESLAVMFKKQCAFLCLLTFDTLFLVICAFYSFPLTLEFSKDSNLVLLFFLVIMYSFMSWGLGKITVRKEDKYLASGFVVLCITYPCLVTYQIYMSTHKILVDNPLYHYSAQYMGIVIMISKLALIVQVIRTCKTFGYGLNTRSLGILKKWLERPQNNKNKKSKATFLQFMKDCYRHKCTSKDKELEYSYKDIYRF